MLRQMEQRSSSFRQHAICMRRETSGKRDTHRENREPGEPEILPIDRLTEFVALFLSLFSTKILSAPQDLSFSCSFRERESKEILVRCNRQKNIMRLNNHRHDEENYLQTTVLHLQYYLFVYICSCKNVFVFFKTTALCLTTYS